MSNIENVKWGLGAFNIYFSGKYENLIALEKDIGSLKGVDDFSGFGESDWFLFNDRSNLAFFMLEVPSFIEMKDKHEFKDLKQIDLSEFVKQGRFSFNKQEFAFFCVDSDELLCCSTKSVSYELNIASYFSLLLGEDFSCEGFVLKSAVDHISSEHDSRDDKEFRKFFEGMLNFCKKEIHDAMDEGEEKYLDELNVLHAECKKNRHKDGRIFHIIFFLENTIATYYS